jgi:hypothetical protein
LLDDIGRLFLRRLIILLIFILLLLRLGWFLVEVKSLASHLRVELEVIGPLVSDRGYKVGKPVAQDGTPPNTALAPIIEEEHVILALGMVCEVVVVVWGRDHL